MRTRRRRSLVQAANTSEIHFLQPAADHNGPDHSLAHRQPAAVHLSPALAHLANSFLLFLPSLLYFFSANLFHFFLAASACALLFYKTSTYILLLPVTSSSMPILRLIGTATVRRNQKESSFGQ